MFKKILVPLDLTDKHGPALTIAAELARQGGGEVILLHVIEEIPGLSEAEVKDFYTRLERAARAHLEGLGASLRAREVPYGCKVVVGNRAPDTVAHARQIAADLIVLTAPLFEPKRPMAGWGSMSWKVSWMAPCPVLIVK
jgi:nucleotide-binding universal stress UspA family protein